MLNSKSVTCLVPAKGASQRLPGKNLRQCNDSSLVKRAVTLAKECGFFDNIVVSTESMPIATAVEGLAEWHLRPDNLCEPESSVWDAVQHYMTANFEDSTDYIMLLHPTSPCLRADTVRDAMEQMLKMEDVQDALVSISKSSPFSYAPAEIPQFHRAKGTQFMLPRFELNNAIYVAKWSALSSQPNGYKLRWCPYQIPKDEAVDIDDETDLHIAEAILQWRQKHEGEEVTKPATEDIRADKPANAGKGVPVAIVSKDAGH